MSDDAVLRAVEAVGEKIDALALRFHDFRVEVEKRLTTQEVRSSILGAIGGALVTVAAWFLKGG